MLSLNIDLTPLFSQIELWFNALWPIAALTIGIPFAFGLISWIGAMLLSGLLKIRR